MNIARPWRISLENCLFGLVPVMTTNGCCILHFMGSWGDTRYLTDVLQTQHRWSVNQSSHTHHFAARRQKEWKIQISPTEIVTALFSLHSAFIIQSFISRYFTVPVLTHMHEAVLQSVSRYLGIRERWIMYSYGSLYIKLNHSHSRAMLWTVIDNGWFAVGRALRNIYGLIDQ